MLLAGPAQQTAQRLAHLGGMLDDALLAERLDRRDPDGARKGMAAVGEPAGEILVADPRSEVLAERHGAERHIAGVDALRHRDDVGNDVPVVDAEPLARAPEA